MSALVSETTSCELELRCGQYLGEISALCLLEHHHQNSNDKLLLAGTGSHILLYDLSTGNPIKSFQVFQGVRVHGIVSCLDQNSNPDCFLIAVFGETRVKLFTLQIQQQSNAQLTLIRSLPRFTHWVLDACFLNKDGLESSVLAVGCSDNSVCFWDVSGNCMLSQVKSEERCLLYAMRMFGDEIESLRIASGTIFNEIVVWRVVCRDHAEIQENNVLLNDQSDIPFAGTEYKEAFICRLVGHEGSIFRIAWFPDGFKLVSVSDDRSARIWNVQAEDGISTKAMHDAANHLSGPVLFGHNARIWDCCISDSLIITAGEDCTCRIWDHGGRELNVIKEHIGRGVWRCLYDPGSSLLVTAGFDSAVKIHQIHLPSIKLGESVSSEDFNDRCEVFALSLPNSLGRFGLMDSKSEYVRCLHFTREDSLYVATNNGYLYHVMLLNKSSVKWTELTRVTERAPIICMDISSNYLNSSDRFEDWIVVGDGKGSMTIIVVVGKDWSRKVEFTLTWSAEKERHLLGTYWCKSLEKRFVFTADPSGRLKLWKLCPKSCRERYDIFLIAEYVSCFGTRIMCVDASYDEELLICGDIRGNLLLFSFPQGLLDSSNAAEVKASPIHHFKGAHGVSSVSSVSVTGLCSDQVEMHSTGADGCICYFHYDRDLVSWEFIGMKQVKELTMIRSVFANGGQSDDCTASNYAVGFASDNFIIWNLTLETKVTQITCGGWRRPHSYYIGDFPESMNCFSFVKDDVIHIRRHWKMENDGQTYPRNLHLTFHGREIHTLCFIDGNSVYSADENQEMVSSSSWIATGCEDGTVRLTSYESGMVNWSSSRHLGEHVGGSAVRSICSVSKAHMFVPDATGCRQNAVHKQEESLNNGENPFVLISVGAKRVITAWKQINRMRKQWVNSLSHCTNAKKMSSLPGSSSAILPPLSFKWLSSDMPFKHNNNVRRKTAKEVFEKTEVLLTTTSDSITVGSHSSRSIEVESGLFLEDDHENDWRYLDVTAFLVKLHGTRISVCFVVVSCSDATVTLRALVLPYRLWFDVALLASLSSPVLALQHVIIPRLPPFEGNIQNQSLYLTIGGSTDGSIAIWDLTECVEKFMQRLSGLEIEKFLEFQKRPRTGRGSQGGRWWRSIDNHKVSNKPSDRGLFSVGRPESGSEMETREFGTSEITLSRKSNGTVPQMSDQTSPLTGRNEYKLSPETTVLGAVHVLDKVHQSGVNCIHVTDTNIPRLSDTKFYFYVVTGGDDQAINCLRCDLEMNPVKENTSNRNGDIHRNTQPHIANNCNHCFLIQNHAVRVSYLDKINSAHSSAVKGVWTDGIWFFSVGLDQRIRCWNFDRDRLREHAHLIVSVPEPEALAVRSCDRNYYQIAVAGRGMQIVEFRPSMGRVL